MSTSHASSPIRQTDSAWVRWTLISFALLFLVIFLVLPLACCLRRSVRQRLADIPRFRSRSGRALRHPSNPGGLRNRGGLESVLRPDGGMGDLTLLLQG